MKKILGFSCAITLLCASAFAQTFEATGTTSGGAVDATGIFVTSANTLDITLNNLIFNQHNENVAENISGIFFNLSNGATFGVGDTLNSSMGTALNVASTGSYTTGPTISPTSWGFAGGGSFGAFTLNALGPVGGGNNQTIIGPSNDGTYTSGSYLNANSSITNGQHDPFLESGATYDLTIPGLTANDSVTSVTFQFGTDFASQLVVGNMTGVPEPSTWICGALATLMLGVQITRAHSFSKRLGQKTARPFA